MHADVKFLLMCLADSAAKGHLLDDEREDGSSDSQCNPGLHRQWEGEDC